MPDFSSQEREFLVQQADTLLDTHDDISRVVSNLSIPMDQFEDQYRSGKRADFNLEAMIRLLVYMEITGRSQNDVAGKMRRWAYLRQRFGFDKPPTQQIISYTRRRRLSRDSRQFISNVGEQIREEAVERDETRIGGLNAKSAAPEPAEVDDSDQPLHHYIDNNAPGVISGLLDITMSSFDTNREGYTKHSDRAIFNQQLMMSLMDRAGTQASYRSFNKFQKDAVHHDTHVRAIKSLGNPDEYKSRLLEFRSADGEFTPLPWWRRVSNTIQNQFSDAVDQMLDSVRRSEMFTEPVVAAIDVTGIPYHVTPWKGKSDIQSDDEVVDVGGRSAVPKEDYPEMVNGVEGSGNYEYQYATLTIVGSNAPLVVAVEPIRHNSRWEDGMTVSYAETVDRLVDQASDLVDIDLVMADREFDAPGVYHVLDQHHDVDYLIPKKKDSEHLRRQAEEVAKDESIAARVEREASLHLRDDMSGVDVENDPTVGQDNHSHDLAFLHVPADRDDWIVRSDNGTDYAIFVTNIPDVTPIQAESLTNRYSSRWDIEISYKMLKPFDPSIASKDYRMRFFSFVFSCLIYNMWRVADHSLKVLASERFDWYGRGPDEKRLDTVIPSADFLVTSLRITFVEAWDPPDSLL